MLTEICVLLLITSSFYKYGESLTVTVDSLTGNDTADCIKGTSVCKSLDYTLNHLQAQGCQATPITVFIHKGVYNYTLDASNKMHQFWNCKDFTIAGVDYYNSTIQCNVTGAGFAFFNASQISISNISIKYCGTTQNSTSYNPVANNMSMVTAALYFAFCQNINLTGMEVTFTNGTGVVMYNTYGDLNVINSSFWFNKNVNGKHGGGGFYAEFCYCDPGYTDGCVQHMNSGAKYIFSNSGFHYNKASDGSERNNTFIFPSETTNIAFGRGGGLSLLFKGRANTNCVVIDNCIFEGNYATWGGGLFIEFQDATYNNYVSIERTKIENNICEVFFDSNHGTGGGGARIGFIFFSPKSVQSNSVKFENCSFTGNSAYWGGGLSFYTPPESDIIKATNTLNFINCTWTSNHAVLGSAVDLSVWHPNKTGVLSTVVFSKCSFANNTNQPYVKNVFNFESSIGTGTLYSDSIPLEFQGDVYFEGNIGSALALSATSAIFTRNCYCSFYRNSGWTGGAIVLLGNAWLKIYDQTTFLFRNNTAIFKGGAISVEITNRHDLLSSRNCFLQYFDQFTKSSKWNTNFYFESNFAPVGSTIFATSLSSCVWGSSVGIIDETTTLSYFHFLKINATAGVQKIASEIAEMTSTSQTWIVIPGKPSQIPLNFTDDIGQQIERLVWLLDCSNENVSFVSHLSADGMITALGPVYEEFSITVASDDPRIVSADVKASLSPCPPGYIWTNESKRCVCAYGKKESWDGITYCDNSKFQAHIQRDYWAGMQNDLLYTGKCPKNFCKLPCSSLLPTENISKQICFPSHRKGILCGECIHGYCVAINSREFVCTNRSHSYSWIVFLSTEFLPSTILFSVILFFDINLHSGAMGPIILFFQVYSSLNIYSDGKITSPDGSKYITKLIDFLYNIWNLEFLGIWLKPYCLAKGFDTMKVLVINYASGFYPFFLIFAVFLFGKIRVGRIIGYGQIGTAFRRCKNCLIRLKWKISLKVSIISGLATFWTLAYTKLAMVSGLILSREYVNGRQDKENHTAVVSMQGSIRYFHEDHLPYAIPALLILIVFVVLPSLALFLYPLVPQLLGKFKKHVNLDESNSYQAISSKMEAPFIYFKPLLDNFQGKYKPRCEYFAGLLFWYRLAIFLTYAFAKEAKLFYFNCAASLIFLFIIAAVKPYKKGRDNMILLLITLNIASINLISLYNYYEDVPDILLWFQILLVICPMVLFAGYILMKVIKKLLAYYKGSPPDGLYAHLFEENFEESDFPAREILQNLAEE
ncbi:uncharacterized protein [Dysidea avara]|uniref:uncharacterized protein n=1 Tax=Dysidea avara TaxID=196820 RepID=UPI00332E4EF0